MIMPIESPAEAADFIRLPPPGRQGTHKRGWRWLLTVSGLALACYAQRGVAWAEVLGLLAGLGPRAIVLMLSISLLMVPLMTARWWLLLQTLGSPLGLLTVSAYRMAANAIGYLTPGPQFGGEPLLVCLLHWGHGIPLLTVSMVF